jgi:cell growth-regulating nucleolar protein
MYKEKAKRKSVSIALPGEEVPKQAYVEDVPDEPGSAVALIEHMPQAPSPPPSAPANPVNVFDFLVADDTPNPSRLSLGGTEEQMQMVEHAQPLFKSLSSSPDDGIGIEHFAANGYTYGAGPLHSQSYDNYRTPASKPARRSHHAHSGSTDKKRKRAEELDLSRASRSSAEVDEDMLDADVGGGPAVLHSGLTGGLNRMLTHPDFPPSPDYSGGDMAQPDPSPLSPAKRKRAPVPSTSSVLSDKLRGRARRTATGQLVKMRKVRRSSDESRPRKRNNQTRDSPQKQTRDSPPQSRPSPPRHAAVKALEFRKDPSPTGHEDNQMIVYQSRAEMFLSFVSKGPESEHGYSVNKALKRYHRERSGPGGKDAKMEAEKELWKSLRLKRNERGEVVVFMG